MLNSILINEAQRRFYSFDNNVVLTAEVDSSGRLGRLDYNSLKVKINAVFFSQFQKLVLPQDNLSEARDILKQLQTKYPNRNLELIFIDNYENVFRNLDIVERHELKFREKLALQYQRHHKTVNWALSVIAILIIVLFTVSYLIPRMDSKPVYGRFEDEKYKAFNKYDIKIWESGKIESNNKDLLTSEEALNRRFVISDIDNDGINEMLYLYMSRVNSETNRTLFCSSPDKATKWVYELGKDNCSFRESEFDENNFQGKSVYVYDFKNNSDRNVIYTVNSESSSSFGILKLDNKGKLISDFWNDGFLTEVKSADFEKVGEQELVAGYCNNRFNKAAIVIFDPDYITGQSPGAKLRKDSLEGCEKYYILFPRSIMNYYCGRDINTIDEIWTLAEGGLSIYTNEGSANEKNPYSFVIYKFDKDMNLIDVTLSSTFVGNYETLLNTNAIKPIGDFNSYSNSLKDSVLYWDGDRFVNHRSINKKYSDIKGNIK